MSIHQTSLFLHSYFNLTPQERVNIKHNYVKKIKTVTDVLITLSLGNDPKFKEGYDGAIALLAECSEKVLIQAINYVKNPLDKANEENLEILIKSVACASKIAPETKLSLIDSLCVNNLGRLTKLTLIDALIILSNDLEFERIKVCLERFASDKETDDYVRHCAKEAIDNIVEQKSKQETQDWNQFSLEQAMKGLEDDNLPEYTENDLIETWQ